jgi:hypothetical protein
MDQAAAIKDLEGLIKYERMERKSAENARNVELYKNLVFNVGFCIDYRNMLAILPLLDQQLLLNRLRRLNRWLLNRL